MKGNSGLLSNCFNVRGSIESGAFTLSPDLPGGFSSLQPSPPALVLERDLDPRDGR
jgi:hypothetical protein